MMPDIRLLQSICKKLRELLPVVLYCIDLKTIGVTYFWCLLEQSICWRGRVQYLSTVSIPAPGVINFCSCLTQLCMKFIMLIMLKCQLLFLSCPLNVKIILIFINMMHTTSEHLN